MTDHERTPFVEAFKAQHSFDDVVGWLGRVRPLKVLTIGETIIDEYAYCQAVGKSSKEPILAVKVTSSESFAGGILAVANHVSQHCDDVGVCSMLGTTPSRQEVIDRALAPAVRRRFLTQQGAPTIVKRRYIDQYFFQKLFEVYEMNDVLAAADDDAVCAALSELVAAADVVVVVDFGHGMLSAGAVSIIVENARFLAVNTQSNAGNLGYHTIARYRRADHVSLAESEIRLELRDRHGPIEGVVERLRERHEYRRIVVTQGSAGCLLWSAEEGLARVPAFADKIVDRVGAGDAFLAITGPLSAIGAPLAVTGFIGNAMGAEAVATVGNRTPVGAERLIARMRATLGA
ncbi:MAG: PfkB family carbohydrate kinase [Deltaproteobacteria bacterium]|nr:PfkB family carbohydrate kinase [Deltaproteobacteria bacterium]